MYGIKFLAKNRRTVDGGQWPEVGIWNQHDPLFCFPILKATLRAAFIRCVAEDRYFYLGYSLIADFEAYICEIRGPITLDWCHRTPIKVRGCEMRLVEQIRIEGFNHLCATEYSAWATYVRQGWESCMAEEKAVVADKRWSVTCDNWNRGWYRTYTNRRERPNV